MLSEKYAIPFTVTDWATIVPSTHPGETGVATWKTLQLGGLRIRMVEYSAQYLADHWCQKGHLFFVLEGELITELASGEKIKMTRGMSYEVSDELIHAICDALLGAANLRDIGFHFSNTDNRWKGKASAFFLQEVTRMLSDKGWSIENVDCTLCLEKPKVNPFIPEMKKVLAPLM